MGCVLGKGASERRQARRKPTTDERPSDSESAAVTIQSDAVERDKELKIEIPATSGGRQSLIMGCAFGKGASGRRERRRKEKHDERRPDSKSAAVTIQNDAVGRDEETKIEVPATSGGRRSLTADSSEFRLITVAAADRWPAWLVDVAGDAIKDWKPRRANTFEKLDKIGQGTYSNVYKARDLITGKVVALKKVRIDNLEPESVKFMAREILILRRLNHPNVVKLEGLVISRMSNSLYLIFEYMEHDLAGLSALQSVNFTEPHVKCYMKQLLSGLEHCHSNGVLHRDIKCSNLLIDDKGILKIADFGLASFFDSDGKKPMTSRVVTLWYRPPELLLGSTYYGVAVDLWSAGCILAELLSGKPILRGRTEVEQLHKIFKLCGSPSDEYWKKSKLPNATLYKPQQPYKRRIIETYKDFPPSSLDLVETLLAIDPDARGTATSALNTGFFRTEPYACEPSNLPKFPPSKELDIKLRDEEARRRRGGKNHSADGNRRARVRDKVIRAFPAPEANAELQINLNRLRIMPGGAKAMTKSEKFPPPHQDGAMGHPLDESLNGPFSFGAIDTSFKSSSIFELKSSRSLRSGATSTRKHSKEEPHKAPSRRFVNAFYPSSINWSRDFRFSRR